MVNYIYGHSFCFKNFHLQSLDILGVEVSYCCFCCVVLGFFAGQRREQRQSIPDVFDFLLIISQIKIVFWMLPNMAFFFFFSFQVNIHNCLATTDFDTWAEKACYCDYIRRYRSERKLSISTVRIFFSPLSYFKTPQTVQKPLSTWGWDKEDGGVGTDELCCRLLLTGRWETTENHFHYWNDE